MNKLEKITSYGLISVESYIFRPSSYEDIKEVIVYAKQNGFKICPIGSGLSFSNVALLDRQIALDVKKLNQILSFDKNNQTITVQAGTKVTEILKQTLPNGLTLVGLTGSYGNTVSGNISNDVNGKDSWKNGNFSSNILQMKVMLTSEEIITVTPNEHQLFSAICGGLGLIAIILEVELKLTPIKGVLVQTETIKCKNLSEQLNQFEQLDHSKDDFAYSWTDAFAPSHQYGRGLFEIGRFVTDSNNSNKINWNKYLSEKQRIFGIKTVHFWKLMRTFYTPSVHKLAGYSKYYASTLSKPKTVPFPEYQYPMTKLFPQWNLLFAPLGFREIQMLFDISLFESAYIETLTFCKNHRISPYICAIRKHKSSLGQLSFAKNGYSFTINFGINNISDVKLQAITDGLLEICTKYNGIVYIGKFPFIDPEMLTAMYPVDKFLKAKNKYDKETLLWSEAASLLLI